MSFVDIENKEKLKVTPTKGKDSSPFQKFKRFSNIGDFLDTEEDGDQYELSKSTLIPEKEVKHWEDHEFQYCQVSHEKPTKYEQKLDISNKVANKDFKSTPICSNVVKEETKAIKTLNSSYSQTAKMTDLNFIKDHNLKLNKKERSSLSSSSGKSVESEEKTSIESNIEKLNVGTVLLSKKEHSNDKPLCKSNEFISGGKITENNAVRKLSEKKLLIKGQDTSADTKSKVIEMVLDQKSKIPENTSTQKILEINSGSHSGLPSCLAESKHFKNDSLLSFGKKNVASNKKSLIRLKGFPDDSDESSNELSTEDASKTLSNSFQILCTDDFSNTKSVHQDDRQKKKPKKNKFYKFLKLCKKDKGEKVMTKEIIDGEIKSNGFDFKSSSSTDSIFHVKGKSSLKSSEAHVTHSRNNDSLDLSCGDTFDDLNKYNDKILPSTQESEHFPSTVEKYVSENLEPTKSKIYKNIGESTNKSDFDNGRQNTLKAITGSFADKELLSAIPNAISEVNKSILKSEKLQNTNKTNHKFNFKHKKKSSLTASIINKNIVEEEKIPVNKSNKQTFDVFQASMSTKWLQADLKHKQFIESETLREKTNRHKKISAVELSNKKFQSDRMEKLCSEKSSIKKHVDVVDVVVSLEQKNQNIYHSPNKKENNYKFSFEKLSAQEIQNNNPTQNEILPDKVVNEAIPKTVFFTDEQERVSSKSECDSVKTVRYCNKLSVYLNEKSLNIQSYKTMTEEEKPALAEKLPACPEKIEVSDQRNDFFTGRLNQSTTVAEYSNCENLEISSQNLSISSSLVPTINLIKESTFVPQDLQISNSNKVLNESTCEISSDLEHACTKSREILIDLDHVSAKNKLQNNIKSSFKMSKFESVNIENSADRTSFVEENKEYEYQTENIKSSTKKTAHHNKEIVKNQPDKTESCSVQKQVSQNINLDYVLQSSPVKNNDKLTKDFIAKQKDESPCQIKTETNPIVFQNTFKDVASQNFNKTNVKEFKNTKNLVKLEKSVPKDKFPKLEGVFSTDSASKHKKKEVLKLESSLISNHDTVNVDLHPKKIVKEIKMNKDISKETNLSLETSADKDSTAKSISASPIKNKNFDDKVMELDLSKSFALNTVLSRKHHKADAVAAKNVVIHEQIFECRPKLEKLKHKKHPEKELKRKHSFVTTQTDKVAKFDANHMLICKETFKSSTIKTQPKTEEIKDKQPLLKNKQLTKVENEYTASISENLKKVREQISDAQNNSIIIQEFGCEKDRSDNESITVPPKDSQLKQNQPSSFNENVHTNLYTSLKQGALPPVVDVSVIVPFPLQLSNEDNNLHSKLSDSENPPQEKLFLEIKTDVSIQSKDKLMFETTPLKLKDPVKCDEVQNMLKKNSKITEKKKLHDSAEETGKVFVKNVSSPIKNFENQSLENLPIELQSFPPNDDLFSKKHIQKPEGFDRKKDDDLLKVSDRESKHTLKGSSVINKSSVISNTDNKLSAKCAGSLVIKSKEGNVKLKEVDISIGMGITALNELEKAKRRKRKQMIAKHKEAKEAKVAAILKTSTANDDKKTPLKPIFSLNSYQKLKIPRQNQIDILQKPLSVPCTAGKKNDTVTWVNTQTIIEKRESIKVSEVAENYSVISSSVAETESLNLVKTASIVDSEITNLYNLSGIEIVPIETSSIHNAKHKDCSTRLADISLDLKQVENPVRVCTGDRSACKYKELKEKELTVPKTPILSMSHDDKSILCYKGEEIVIKHESSVNKIENEISRENENAVCNLLSIDKGDSIYQNCDSSFNAEGEIKSNLQNTLNLQNFPDFENASTSGYQKAGDVNSTVETTSPLRVEEFDKVHNAQASSAEVIAKQEEIMKCSQSTFIDYTDLTHQSCTAPTQNSPKPVALSEVKSTEELKSSFKLLSSSSQEVLIIDKELKTMLDTTNETIKETQVSIESPIEVPELQTISSSNLPKDKIISKVGDCILEVDTTGHTYTLREFVPATSTESFPFLQNLCLGLELDSGSPLHFRADDKVEEPVTINSASMSLLSERSSEHHSNFNVVNQFCLSSEVSMSPSDEFGQVAASSSDEFIQVTEILSSKFVQATTTSCDEFRKLTTSSSDESTQVTTALSGEFLCVSNDNLIPRTLNNQISQLTESLSDEFRQVNLEANKCLISPIDEVFAISQNQCQLNEFNSINMTSTSSHTDEKIHSLTHLSDHGQQYSTKIKSLSSSYPECCKVDLGLCDIGQSFNNTPSILKNPSNFKEMLFEKESTPVKSSFSSFEVENTDDMSKDLVTFRTWRQVMKNNCSQLSANNFKDSNGLEILENFKIPSHDDIIKKV